MSFVETEVEIETALQAHNTEKLVTRFCLLMMYFHFNLCKKEGCSTWKFLDTYINFLLWGKFSWEERISSFLDRCRKNHKQFYFLFSLFCSLTKSGVEKVNLNDKLKALLIVQYGKHI